jgi:hypothetical protein
MAACAICAGVTGIAGCLLKVSPAPVTAQVMITSVFMCLLRPNTSGHAEDCCGHVADYANHPPATLLADLPAWSDP